MGSRMWKWFALAITVACVGEISCQTTEKPMQNTTSSPPPTTAKPTTQAPATSGPTGATTTVSPEEMCQQHNKSCDDCLSVAGAKCVWCKSTSRCELYPLSKVLPTSICALDQARWGVCWMNFEALIISMSVIGGVIILSFTCCIVYCCCCRGGSSTKYDKEDARYKEQKLERKAKNDERKAERKERLDEIRRKYGLMKDEPYQRFDA